MVRFDRLVAQPFGLPTCRAKALRYTNLNSALRPDTAR